MYESHYPYYNLVSWRCLMNVKPNVEVMGIYALCGILKCDPYFYYLSVLYVGKWGNNMILYILGYGSSIAIQKEDFVFASPLPPLEANKV